MGPGTETGTGPPAMHELVRLLHPTLASHRVAHLAPRARRRYEERVRELLARVRRELEEFQAMLEAEQRRGRRRQPDERGKGEASVG